MLGVLERKASCQPQSAGSSLAQMPKPNDGEASDARMVVHHSIAVSTSIVGVGMAAMGSSALPTEVRSAGESRDAAKRGSYTAAKHEYSGRASWKNQ